MKCEPGYVLRCVPAGEIPPGTKPPTNGKPPMNGDKEKLYEVFALPWAHDLGGSGVIGYSPVIMDTRTGQTRPATKDELVIALEKIGLALAIIIENEGGSVQPTTQRICA